MLEHDCRLTIQARRARDHLGSRDGYPVLQQRRRSSLKDSIGAIASPASALFVNCNALRLEHVSNLIVTALSCSMVRKILRHDTRPIHKQNSSKLWLTCFEKDLRQVRQAELWLRARRTLDAIVTWDLDLSKL
jgi:hypothetical protein